jgi:hypothetical protein
VERRNPALQVWHVDYVAQSAQLEIEQIAEHDPLTTLNPNVQASQAVKFLQ